MRLPASTTRSAWPRPLLHTLVVRQCAGLPLGGSHRRHRVTPSPGHYRDIRLREGIACAQQLVISYGGQCVAEAITDVECGPVSPFAEPDAGFLSHGALFGVNGDQLNFQVSQQCIEIASATLAEPTDQHKTRFDGRGDTHEARGCLVQPAQKLQRVRLFHGDAHHR